MNATPSIMARGARHFVFLSALPGVGDAAQTRLQASLPPVVWHLFAFHCRQGAQVTEPNLSSENLLVSDWAYFHRYSLLKAEGAFHLGIEGTGRPI